MKILILEGDPVQAESMATMVKKFGYEVVGPAYSAEDAIHLFRAAKPDLLLLDIRLGGNKMNGIEAAKIMLSIRNVPHVYISAFTEEYRLELPKTGPEMAFSKPYNERDIQMAVELGLTRHAEESIAPIEGKNLIFPNLIISKDCLWIKSRIESRERFFKMPVEELVYVKSDNVYLSFYFSSKNLPIVIVMRIGEFYEAIQGLEHYRGLIRVSQSYIIHAAHITTFTRTYDEVTMTNEHSIRVTDSYKDSFKDFMTQGF
jgi:DNA-binding LytR/AlgR family response regulator